MRLVIQRVVKAKVKHKEKNIITGQIDEGLLVLLGIKKGDTEKEADYLAEKLTKLRIMSDKDKK